MKKISTLSFILGGLGLLVASSGCHKSIKTASSGKSTDSMQVVKKTEQRDSLLLPVEMKPEEIYDKVPVRVKTGPR